MTVTSLTLRPLSLGELLDQSIRLYRRNFLKFIGIMALIQVPIGLLQLIYTILFVDNFLETFGNPAATPSPEEAFGSMAGFFTSSIFSAIISIIFISGIATAALTRAIADNYLGRNTGILDAYRRIGNTWLRLVGAVVLGFLIILGLAVWTVVPCIGWVSGFGMLIYAFMVVYPLIAPIVVLERQGASAAIRRAWELARRRFWWILGFVFILYLFSQLIITGPSLLATFLMGAFITAPAQVGAQNVLSTVIQSIVSLALSLLYLPLQQTATTLLYFDLRVRTEGFDLQVLANESAGQTDRVEDLIVNAAPARATSLITGHEFGYFVVITLGGIILYILLVALFIAIAAGFSMMFGGL